MTNMVRLTLRKASFFGIRPFERENLTSSPGPVVRVSPNELSFSNAEAWQDIYGHRNGHANFHKDPIHVGSVEAVPGVTTLTMSDDENHARQRKGLSYAFSMKALLEQEELINSHVTKLMDNFWRLARAQ